MGPRSRSSITGDDARRRTAGKLMESTANRARKSQGRTAEALGNWPFLRCTNLPTPDRGGKRTPGLGAHSSRMGDAAMGNRFLKLTALAVVPVALAACSQDTTTQVESVRLAVQETRIAGSDHGGHPFATALTQEVTQTPVWSGDADGTGEALLTVNLGQAELCWQISVENIALTATAAHIHQAAPGVRDEYAVGLSAPDDH